MASLSIPYYDDPISPRSLRMIMHRAKSALIISSFVAICLAFLLWTSRRPRGSDMGEFGYVARGEEGRQPEAVIRDWDYRRALQYEGTGARVQAFLEKAKSGKPFTVSVIGGSGRGLRRWQNGQYLPPLPRRQPKPGAGKKQGDGVRRPAPRGKREDDLPDEELPLGLGLGLGVDHAGGGRKGLLGAESPDGSPVFGTRTLYSPENMHVQIFDFLNATFPHPENRLVNGAQGGVGSGYFGWCFKEHIPEDSDLILVELGINDLVEIDGFETYEMLIRRALELNSQPAIINIEVFTTLFSTLMSSSSLHTDVAAFYDIPSLSIRDVLLPRITEDPEVEMPKWFRSGPNVMPGDPKVREFGGVSVDLMHISALGHAFTANLVIKYLQGQLATLSKSVSHHPPALEVPAATLTDKDILGNIPAGNVVCRTMNSANLHPALGLIGTGNTMTQGVVPAEGSFGWEKYHFKEKKYLVAKKPGARFIYHFHIATGPGSSVIEKGEEGGRKLREDDLNDNFRQNVAKAAGGAGAEHGGGKRPQGKNGSGRGSVSIGYQRSKILGFGSVLCWVDEHKADGRVIDGWWDIAQRNMGRVSEVAGDLAPGSHTLHCELLETTHDADGRTEFRIFAVMHN